MACGAVSILLLLLTSVLNYFLDNSDAEEFEKSSDEESEMSEEYELVCDPFKDDEIE